MMPLRMGSVSRSNLLGVEVKRVSDQRWMLDATKKNGYSIHGINKFSRGMLLPLALGLLL